MIRGVCGFHAYIVVTLPTKTKTAAGPISQKTGPDKGYVHVVTAQVGEA
jgi:hypothetical protein